MNITEVKSILNTRLQVAEQGKNHTEKSLILELLKICDEFQTMKNNNTGV